MQYWQRRLHRSVTDRRRLRSGRAKRSRIDWGIKTLIITRGFPFRGTGGCMARGVRSGLVLLFTVLVAAAAAALLAQEGAKPSAPAKEDPRVERLKKEAMADVESMATLTQQMVDQ